MTRKVHVGVLALQGNVSEHIFAFQSALQSAGIAQGSTVIPIRRAEEISRLDVLAIPGGESTTISRLIDKMGMRDPIEKFEGAIFATCAGMVLMASELDDPRLKPLGLIDMKVIRNAFGRQRESFETDLDIKGLDSPYHAIFIRAPVAIKSGKKTEVLSSIDKGIVAIRQERFYAMAFHPELGHDLRIHTMFLQDTFQ